MSLRTAWGRLANLPRLRIRPRASAMAVVMVSPGLSVTHDPGASRSFHPDWADEQPSRHEFQSCAIFQAWVPPA